jgi:hypothetical protein
MFIFIAIKDRLRTNLLEKLLRWYQESSTLKTALKITIKITDKIVDFLARKFYFKRLTKYLSIITFYFRFQNPVKANIQCTPIIIDIN